MSKTKSIYSTIRSAKFVLKPNIKQKRDFRVLFWFKQSYIQYFFT